MFFADLLRYVVLRGLTGWPLGRRFWLPALIRFAWDDYLARDAIEDAARLGPRARWAAPALIARLGDRDLLVRSQAAWAIQAIQPVRHLARLQARLDKLDPVTRAEMIDDIGPLAAPFRQPSPALDEALKSRNLLAEAAAVQALGDQAIPSLIRATTSLDFTVQDQAIAALGRHGAGSQAAIATLIHLLTATGGNRDFMTTSNAGNALFRLGPAARAAIPVLIHRLGNKETQLYAVKILGAIGPEAVEALPKLLAILRATSWRADPLTYSFAAWSVWRINGDADAALKRLMPMLAVAPEDQNASMAQEYAALRLGDMGGAAAPATLDLLRVLMQGDDDEALAAVRALARIGSGAIAAGPTLAHELTHPVQIDLNHWSWPDWPIAPQLSKNRIVVALAHWRITGTADLAVAALIELFQEVGPFFERERSVEPDLERAPWFRAEVAQALAEIGPGAVDALPALAQGVADASEEYLREAATAAIQAIAPAASPTAGP